jgi:hypothetical protein
VRLAAAELLEAAAGARDADRDPIGAAALDWNSSAMASVIGNTVLEPSTWMVSWAMAGFATASAEAKAAAPPSRPMANVERFIPLSSWTLMLA